jgi:hypothetical protein
MTAQIIPLADYRSRQSETAEPQAALAAPELAAAPVMPLLPVIAGCEPSREATIVVATAALSAACRDMAANLATLMAHAEAACHSIGSIGETAEALIRTGSDLQQVAATFKQDHDRVSEELSAIGQSTL